MKTIYKYNIENSKHIDMPVGAEVISAGVDPMGFISIWAYVDTEETETITKTFEIMGTGWNMNGMENDKLEYIFLDTVIKGPYVWHIFEVFD